MCTIIYIDLKKTGIQLGKLKMFKGWIVKGLFIKCETTNRCKGTWEESSSEEEV